MDVIVDDHLLLRILLGDEPASLRRPGAQLLTTGLWYHRLCRAVANPSVVGVMSRMLGRADPSVAVAAVAAITELPAGIGLLSLRELAWPMARLLDQGVRLNLLSLEALAAAEVARAELCLAAGDENTELLRAAADRGTPVRLLEG